MYNYYQKKIGMGNLKINGSESYYESHDACGKAIVFLHGNSLSSKTFKYQFKDSRLNQFRLVSFDFPGHGNSFWSKHPKKDYSLFGLRDFIVEALEKLNITNYIFAGHSLGGHVAIECLPFVNNCRGIIIWGTPPTRLPLETSKLFYPNPDISLFYKSGLKKNEMEKLGKLILNAESANLIEAEIKKTDPNFRDQFPKSLAEGELSDEISLLANAGIPVAILHGKNDPMVRVDYLEKLNLSNLWKSKILILNEAGHSMQMDSYVRFNRIIFEFATSVFNGQ